MNQKGGAFPLIPILLSTAHCTRLGTFWRELIQGATELFGGNLQSDPTMKKMTLVEQAVLDRLRQKQIAQEIQKPELSAMVKIRTQIEDRLRSSKLTDTEKLDILERAQEKYAKLKDSMRPTKSPIVEEGGTAPASMEVTPSELPLFQPVNLPANRKKKFNKFLKFVEDNPDLIARNEMNEMVVECKTLEGSNIDDPIRNFYVQNTMYNLTGIHDFSQALSKANLSNSAISNSNFKQLMSLQKQSQFHTPAISSQKSPAHQTTQKKGPNVFDIPGDKRHYRGKDFTHNPEPWLPPQKELSGFSMLNPLKSIWKTSSTEQVGKGKRTPAGKRPHMPKLYR